MSNFEKKLEIIFNRVSNHKKFLKVCDSGGDWELDEFMEALSGHVNCLRSMLITVPTVVPESLISIECEEYERLQQVEKYYNCLKTFDSFSAKIFYDIMEKETRDFDELMEEHILLSNKAKEYRLLQSLPFLASGKVFIEYTIHPETMEYYVDGSDEEDEKLFSDYENAILRSILDNNEWVEVCH